MKQNMFKWLIVTALICTALACSSKPFIKPTQDAIDLYVQNNPDLPDLDKQCVYDGRFEIGMKLETLEFLLGKPDRLDTVKQQWAVQENWTYHKNGKKLFVIEEKHVVGILEPDNK